MMSNSKKNLAAVMSCRQNNILIQSLADLASVLKGADIDASKWQAIEEIVNENELQDSKTISTWLLELITSIRDKKLTEGWVDFSLDGLDNSNNLNLIRELDQVLPINYENNEESWMLIFPDINIEVCISLEGSCYKVSEIGGTWDWE